MQALSILITFWLVALGLFTGFMVYRANLTQHETDELFLDDTADDSNRKFEHDEIVRKVGEVTPYCQGAGGVTAALTVAILGVMIVHNLPYVHFR